MKPKVGHEICPGCAMHGLNIGPVGGAHRPAEHPAPTGVDTAHVAPALNVGVGGLPMT